jgi:hypothetical protein
MSTVTDTFTDTAGDNIATSHTTDSGHDWASHAAYAGNFVITDANRARWGNTSPGVFYIGDWTPSSADYDVTIDLYCKTASDTSDRGTGPAGRIDEVANTLVYIRYESGGNQWLLCERIAGTENIRDTHTSDLHETADTVKTVKLELRGTTAKGYIDGVEILSGTLTTVTSAGRAGVRGRASTASNAAGYHIDNFVATDDIGGGTDHTETPAAVTATGQTLAPTISVGSNVTLTPSAGTATGATLAPTVTGGLTVTPSPATAAGATPVLVPEATFVADAVTATAGTSAPTVTTGSNVTLTPASVTAAGGTNAPTVTLGVTAAPASATAAGATNTPAVQLGLTLTPAAVTATGQTLAPTVTAGGNVTLTPGAVTAAAVTGSPTVSTGATVTVTAVPATAGTFAPSVSAGSDFTYQATAASATAGTTAVTLTISTTGSPDPAGAAAATLAPSAGPTLIGRLDGGPGMTSQGSLDNAGLTLTGRID